MPVLRPVQRLVLRDILGLLGNRWIRNLGGVGVDLGAPFAAPGGSTYLDANDTLTATEDALTVSFWLYHEDDDEPSGHVFNNDAADEIRVTWGQTNENVATRFVNNAGSTQAQFAAAANNVLAGDIKHYMISGSIASSRVSIWVNGVESAFDATVAGLGWDLSTAFALFHDGGAANVLVWTGMGIQDIWINNEYVSDPVGVFIEAATTEGPGAVVPTPRAGGADGAGYTGNVPLHYLRTSADIQAGINSGSGSDWTVTGSTWNEVTP